MLGKAVVTVKEGKVRGIKTTSSFSGIEFYSFYGVPYGQSTAGKARFKDPVKIKPWENVYDATTEREGCTHFSVQRKIILGNEDCLYNNIYTPKLPTKDDPLKPVVVLIHPGGFFHGTPEPWCYGSPNYVMHRDIIYVCVGYRLHILGFLNLGIKECSGNQGLKDIILSLKWIRENISAFGGDPENLTLLGSSSGSAIVHFLMLSPAAKGLFHKAVMMSIYIYDPTLPCDGEHMMSANEMAHELGYYSTDLEDKKRLLSFFKKIKLDEFAFLTMDKIERNRNLARIFPTSRFIPTIDFGENAVLPGSHRELMVTMSRIPLIYGICDKEAAAALARPFRKATMENFNTVYLQNIWGWGQQIDKKDVEIINQRIRTFYLNGESIEKASMNLKIDILTDIAFSDVYETLINFISADLLSPVFVYKFEFQGSLGTFGELLKKHLEEPLNGTCHADDFSYWAHITEVQGSGSTSLKSKSVEIIDIFTKMICYFARTGDPNHEDLNVVWRHSTLENPCYLSINHQLQVIDGKLNGKRMEFLENLKNEFRKK